jgi:hypothetical protein
MSIDQQDVHLALPPCLDSGAPGSGEPQDRLPAATITPSRRPIAAPPPVRSVTLYDPAARQAAGPLHTRAATDGACGARCAPRSRQRGLRPRSGTGCVAARSAPASAAWPLASGHAPRGAAHGRTGAGAPRWATVRRRRCGAALAALLRSCWPPFTPPAGGVATATSIAEAAGSRIGRITVAYTYLVPRAGHRQLRTASVIATAAGYGATMMSDTHPQAQSVTDDAGERGSRAAASPAR